MTIEFCQKCIAPLCRKGLKEVETFKIICESYLLHGEYLEMFDPEKEDDLSDIFIFLENMGFIISSEIDKNVIRIIPLHIYIYTEGSSYSKLCFKKHND